MKRFVSLLTLLVMIFSFSPASAEKTAFTALYSSEVTTLNYLITASTNEFSVAANVIDTLVEYDQYGQVHPSLAERWEKSDDGLVWTFFLRKGVKWVDGNLNEYAEVTANDFVTAAKYILDAKNASGTANIFYDVVNGAEEYYNGTATPTDGATPAPKTEWDTVGVKALDDYTLQYTLKKPVPYFLSMTTYVCFMPVNEKFLLEKGENFGLATGNDTLLYNGAYVISEFKPQEKRVYKKNTTNWDAEHVYIESVEQTYNKEATALAPELYMRGETDYADIDTAIATQWLSDPKTADLIRPVRQTGFYSYFFSFNFKPEFDAAYEPENWKLAVNNKNFRKAIFYGLDRLKIMLAIEPNNPESILFNTVTPPAFVDVNGQDYVETGDLAAWTAMGRDVFNTEKAKEYAAKAKEELTQAGVTFPIKMLTSYNPNSSTWAEQCQIYEQQLEALFGADFIDIIIEAGPSSGFLTAVRRSGKYAFLLCNWGPDYADPETYTDPFRVGATYNFPEFTTDVDENGKNIAAVYHEYTDAAKAIYENVSDRYAAFAKAEAYLIDEAFIIPFGYGSGGYVASRLNPFEAQYAPFGLSNVRYKGMKIMEKPMNTDLYFEALDTWNAERAALANDKK